MCDKAQNRTHRLTNALHGLSYHTVLCSHGRVCTSPKGVMASKLSTYAAHIMQLRLLIGMHGIDDQAYNDH